MQQPQPLQPRPPEFPRPEQLRLQATVMHPQLQSQAPTAAPAMAQAPDLHHLAALMQEQRRGPLRVVEGQRILGKRLGLRSQRRGSD